MSGPPDLNLLEDLGFVNPWRFARQSERDTRPSGVAVFRDINVVNTDLANAPLSKATFNIVTQPKS
jgi:hypothetical protein